MATSTIRFGPGAGLQVSTAEHTQGGLLVAENVDLSAANTLEKRTGATAISPQRSSTSTDLIPPEELRSVWHRGPELVLETDREIYSRQRCVADGASPIPAGTASPAEVAAASAQLEARANTFTAQTALGVDPAAAIVRARAARADLDKVVGYDPGTGTGPWEIEIINMMGMGYVRLDDGVNDFTIRLRGYKITRGRIAVQVPTPERVQVSYLGLSGLSGTAPRLYTDFLSFPTADPDDVELVGQTIYALAGTLANADFAMAEANVQTGHLANQGRPIFYFEQTGSRYLTAALHDDSGNRRTRIAFSLETGKPYRLDAAVFNVAPPFQVHAVAVAIEETGRYFSLVESALPFQPPGTSATLDVAPDVIKPMALSSTSTAVAAVADPTGPEPERSVQTFLGVGVGPVMERAPVADTWRFVDLAGDDLLFHVKRGEGDITYAHEWDGVGGIATEGPETVGDSAWAVQGSALYGALISELDGEAYDLAGDVRDVLHVVPVATGIQGVAHVGAFATGTWVGALYSFADDVQIRMGTSPGAVGAVNVYISADAGGAVAADVVSDLGGTDAILRVAYYAPAFGALEIVTYNTDTGELTNADIHGTPAAVTALTLGLTPGGGLERALVGFEYQGGSREIFEADPDVPLWVRVDPALLALPGGNWSLRGPWTRMSQRVRARRQFNTQLNSTEAVQIVAGSELEPCTVLVHDVEPPAPADPDVPQGVVLDVIGANLETSTALAVTGTRPRVGKVSDKLAVYSYLDAAFNLLFQLWAPTETLSPAPTGITTTADRIYDMHTREVDGVGYVAWAAIAPGSQERIQVRTDTGAVVVDFTGPIVDTPTDAVVYILPDQGDGFLWLAFGRVGTFAGNDIATVGILKVTLGAPGSLAVEWAFSFTPSDIAHAVVVEAVETTSLRAWVEVDNADSGLRNVEFWAVDDSPSAGELRPTLRDMAINSTIEPIAGEPAAWLSLLGPDKVRRSGLILFAPGSGEVIGRCCVGRAELGGRTESLDQRKQRSAKNTLTIGATGNYLLGVGLFPDGQPYQASTVEMTPGGYGNQVPTVSGTAVSAHGGYARAYDGGLAPDAGPFEHDWHELPRIISAVETAPGNLAKGSYGLAMTYRWHDSNGLRYRSEPDFARVVLTQSADIFLAYEGLSITERKGVVVEFWRTNVDAFGGDAGLYRLAATVENDPLSSTLSVLLDQDDDAIAGNELLDAVSLGLAPSAPAAATDFLASVAGRLWTRDPERPSQVWFSQRRQAGLGLSWALGQISEMPDERAVTAVGGYDGRVVLLSDATAAVIQGEGPSSTGVGGYARARDVPVGLGAERQLATTASTYGLIYGAPGANAPRLLDRGLSMAEIGEPVAGAYEDEARAQRVSAAVYEPLSETVYFFDDGAPGSTRQTLRWHAPSGRWASDTNRQAHDASISSAGELAILTADLRILVADDSYTDGGLGYTFRVKTPWLRQGQSGAYPHFVFQTATVFGKHQGSHELYVDVFCDYEAEPRYRYHLPAAVLDTQAAAGEDYAYQLPAVAEQVWAVAIEVRDGGEAGPTFRLEGIDVTMDGSGSVTPATLPAGHLFDSV